jgi:RecB family exonuclease
MIRTYLQWVSHNLNMPLAAEHEFRIELCGVPFIGYIDRVEQRPDSQIEIVDFKTGAGYENSKSIKDPQINICAIGAQK